MAKVRSRYLNLTSLLQRQKATIVGFVLYCVLTFASIHKASTAAVQYMPEPGIRRITKVSMLYGKPNTFYQRALQTHRGHARRWGYRMEVLTHDIAVGYWNKPSYLLSLVIQELAKPASERTEWLMWVDADSIILNPAIPAETFLPPFDLDNVHVVASKDQNGLNTGIFFLHVHPWSVDMLVEAIALPLYQPDIDLGTNPDQLAMALVFNQIDGGPSGHGYKDGVVYLPRPWINAYEWSHAYEGKKGDMLVHFPGMQEERWTHMSNWLDIVEMTPQKWEVPFEETEYPNRTNQFWAQYRTSRDVALRVEKALDEQPSNAAESTRTAISSLWKALQEEADNSHVVRQRLESLEEAAKLDQVLSNS
ncbi:CAZyme family GT34 [Paecilomyces variotii]|nr:CAZyme family GT34 [Paecilomyces variotii]